MNKIKRYPSRYGGGNITAAQFLAELACEHDALRKKQKLPNKFWNHNRWKRSFLSQVQAAYPLLKIYDDEVIINAFSSNPQLYSLRSVKLDALCDQEQRKVDSMRENLQAPTAVDEGSKVRKPFRIKKSKLGKLK